MKTIGNNYIIVARLKQTHFDQSLETLHVLNRLIDDLCLKLPASGSFFFYILTINYLVMHAENLKNTKYQAYFRDKRDRREQKWTKHPK